MGSQVRVTPVRRVLQAHADLLEQAAVVWESAKAPTLWGIDY